MGTTAAADDQLSAQRRFTSPLPGEDLAAIAGRCLPELGEDAALEALKSWNLHLFMRQPMGQALGCDIVFLEAPRTDGAAA